MSRELLCNSPCPNAVRLNVLDYAEHWPSGANLQEWDESELL